MVTRWAFATRDRRKTALEIATIIIAVLAFVATAWQAYIANDSEKRQLRAYVGVHQVSYQGLENSEPIGFAFTLVNHGQTLAKKANFVGIIDLLPYPLPTPFKLQAPPDRPSQDGIIFSNETPPMIGWVWERTPMTESDKQALFSRSGTKQIYMHGSISYEDIFGKPRKTTFCFFLNPASIVRDASGAIVRDGNGRFSFQVAPCEGRNRLE
jgi:hypothetical protein